MYELHGPTELCDNLQVGEFGHVGMGPCVHGDVMVDRIEQKLDLIGVGQNLDTDNEMSGSLVVLLKELGKPVGNLIDVSTWLKKS
jgi:hypothetical protein